LSQIITDFVSAYLREYDHYQSAAGLCSQRCEKLLATQGIRAIVSHRAKKPTKLNLKLQQRDKDKKYKSADQIRADIPDLAGVRIALYFPGDRGKVESILQENFDIILTKNFPEKKKQKKDAKRFDGYHADHYRVQMRETSLDDAEKAYGVTQVEIQVGSVLMHSWAEVEHDLIYKPESGTPSEDEHAILDELNGLVIAGEIALERLQKAVERRLSVGGAAPFDNHYELAAYLHKWMRAHQVELPIGRVDILWELLKRADLNRQDRLEPLLPPEHEALMSQSALSDQIIDAIPGGDPTLYLALQSNLIVPDAYVTKSPQAEARAGSTTEFLAGWILLERTFKNIDPSDGPRSNPVKKADMINMSPASKDTISWVRRLRNNLVHGIEIPPSKTLKDATAALESVFNELSNSTDPNVRKALEDARNESKP